MANTLPNVTDETRRIHESYPIHELENGVSFCLSSQEGSFAQMEFANIKTARRFGRSVLRLNVVDRSGIGELSGSACPTATLQLRLGHTAVIGRGSHDLPLLGIGSVSERHLELTYATDVYYGPVLMLNDFGSTNGSHIVETDEPSWEQQIAEYSKGELGYNDPKIYPTTYDWLYDSSQARPAHF